MTDTTERWLPVPGFEGRYEVSDQGRVKSLERCVTISDPRKGKGFFVHNIPEKIMKQKLCRCYWQVTLSKENSQQTFNVHQLVAQAFLGPCPAGFEVCHGDKGRSTNTLDNISYGTRSKNNSNDKLRDGTAQLGERNCRSKLNSSLVVEMRRLKDEGWSYSQLAEFAGVTRAAARFAVTGRTWGHIPRDKTSTPAR